MALLVCARLSSLDDDDDDATASSPSRSPSPPLVSPTVRRVAVLGAPRVAAQLSSSMDDEEGEVFDDAMDYGEEDEVLQEVPHGFFRVARVPPPWGEDPFSGDEKPAGSASASESEYFAAAVRSLEEGARSGLEDAAGVIVGDKGTGVEGSDGSVLKDGDRQGDQGVGAEAVNDGVAEPFIADARGIDGGAMRVVESLEGKDGGILNLAMVILTQKMAHPSTSLSWMSKMPVLIMLPRYMAHLTFLRFLPMLMIQMRRRSMMMR